MLAFIVMKTLDLAHFLLIHHFIPALKKNHKAPTGHEVKKVIVLDKATETMVKTTEVYANYAFEFFEAIYAIIWVACGLIICTILTIMKQNKSWE